MGKTIVVYGSTTGSCEDFANRIASQLGDADVVNVTDMTAEQLNEYDNLLLGTSTWGAGEVQDDWYSAFDTLKAANLAGKTVALFGCGDAGSYPDTFCGGISEIYDVVKDSGAKLVGAVDAGEYEYDDSTSVVDGKFVGLALDVEEDDAKIDDRIATWVGSIKAEL